MTAREIVRWTAGAELDARAAIVDRTKLEPRVARHARAGRLFLRLGLPKESGRRKWQQRVDRFFGDADVFLSPGLARPPLPAKEWGRSGWLANVLSNAIAEPFAAPWNLAGWPAIAVPAGLDPRGLPLGVQLVTRPGGEAQLLSLAAQLEEARPWPRVAESLA
jgi:amidase